jgi:putative polyhydroxyalkanoate system protein
MAGFRLTKPYTMSEEEVREAAEGLAASLERDHGVRAHWEDKMVRITGAGVNGQMSFHDGLIDVSVRLGLLASMFEPVLRSEVERYLDQHVS